MTDNKITGQKPSTTSGIAQPHSGETGEWGVQMLRARIGTARELNTRAAERIEAMLEMAELCVSVGEIVNARKHILAAELSVADTARLDAMVQLLSLGEARYVTQ